MYKISQILFQPASQIEMELQQKLENAWGDKQRSEHILQIIICDENVIWIISPFAKVRNNNKK